MRNSTHVFRLSNFLKTNNINVWVQGAVFFSNRSTRVNISNHNNKVPVFVVSKNGVNDLLQYINTYKVKKELDTGLIDEMVRLLENQCK